ncbi:MAG TPA: recombinase RecT [Syntrophales bacterium]|nr:recombinase RecT [Syntrophales bacterium]
MAQTQNLPATQKAANIRGLLEKSRRQLEMALPKHLTADRLLRVAMTSIQRTPKLLDCTQRSLLACIMTCAQLGLEPDQFLGQAYLVPFGNVCTLIPGYRGYIALARRSGEVQSVSAQAVYDKDHFVLQYGIDEKLEHVPYEPSEKELDGQDPRGSFKGAYVIFKYKDGSYSFDYMGKAEIDRIRKRSKASSDGPWVTDYAEMAKKTVIKRHSKLAPLSVEFQRAVALEDRAMAGESQADLLNLGTEDEGTIDVEAGEVKPDKEALLAAFDASIPKGADNALVESFLQKIADTNKKTVEEVKVASAENKKDLAALWKLFPAWCKQQKAQGEKAPEDLAPGPCPNNPGDTYAKKYCDGCPERKGCPVWETKS